MRAGWLALGLVVLFFGGYPPFNLWAVLIGIGLTIFGLKAEKKKK
jgi:hypothetical protein